MSYYYMKWDEYNSQLSLAFNELRSKEDYVDVTLCCEGRKIRAHKIMLSAFSSYFRDIFQENPTPHPVIILKNVKYDVLLAIVDFIYRVCTFDTLMNAKTAELRFTSNEIYYL